MQAKNVHCTVVEVDRDAHLVSCDAQDPPRDLLPWADPYIARLLTKYRLQAALDDSLRFVSDEAARAHGGRAMDGRALDGDAAYRDNRNGRTPGDRLARFTTGELRRPLPPASGPPAGEDRPLG